MAVAIHSTTPAAVVSDTAVASLTTAAFTPPAGAVLLMVAVFDTATSTRTGTPSTVSGATSAWTTVGNFNNGNGTTGGLVHVSWARVVTSQSTTARVTWPASNDCAMKVYVLTGAVDTGSPIGASGSTTLSTNPQTVSYTATAAGSQGFIALEDFSQAGNKTISSAVVDATLATNSNGVIAHDLAVSGATGQTRSFSISGAAGGASVAWVEVIPTAPTGGGSGGTSGTGGSGGPLTDRTNVAYTNTAGTASVGHIYAAGLDWSRPVGVLVYGDGSGEFGLVNPTSTYLLGGTNGLIAVAKKHNMVLVTPRAPGNGCLDGDGVCWYDASNDGTSITTKIKWCDDFIQTQVLTKYNIDTTRVCIAGYSSGAQLTSEYYGPQYASAWMQDGLLLSISYGGSPKVTANYPTAFKSKVAAVWDVGANDPAYTTTSAFGVQAGYNWYTSNGFAVTELNVIPGTDHARDGQFGAIVDREVTQHVAASVTSPGTLPGNVTVRSSTEDGRGTAGNPCVPTLPAGVVEGDLLLCVHTSDLNGVLANMTAPTGWTLDGSSSRTDVGFMKVWRKVATASEPASYSFTTPVGAHTSAVVLAVSGQDATAPIAVTSTFASGAAATAHPAPSVAGVAGGLLVTAHLAGTSGTARTYTPPPGMTEQRESAITTSPNITTEVNTLPLAAGGPTNAKQATCSGSTPYLTMSLVVAPVTVAVTQTPGTASGAGAALDASAQSTSQATAGRGSATGAALNPTVAATSRNAAVAGRGSATGAANSPSVATTSTTSTRVIAGLAAATGSALGSNTGTANGFQVVASALQGTAGLFPSDALFPSDTLFPSDGGGAVPQDVIAVGISSAEAFGSPVVTIADGPLFIEATSIDSAEAFGVPTVSTDVGPQDIAAVGIPTGEAFGRPTVTPEVALPPDTPAATYFDTYYLDGVDLSTFTTQIEAGEGLQDTPGTVGDNVELPGRDGALEVYGAPGQMRRPDGQGRLTLDMWLIGVDPATGELVDSAASAQSYLARWDELVRMFHRRRFIVDHPRPDGTRRAIGHLVPGESMSPSSRTASPWFGRFRASVAIPAAHWTDTTEITTGPTALTTNGVLSLSLFAAATAPCTELTVTFGPGNNPRLSTSYGFVGFNGVIAAGRQLTVNTATGQLGTGSGQLWAPPYDGLIYSPGPRLFEIDPSESLQAILTHTTGGSMTVEVAGKRRYRTS